MERSSRCQLSPGAQATSTSVAVRQSLATIDFLRRLGYFRASIGRRVPVLRVLIEPFFYTEKERDS